MKRPKQRMPAASARRRRKTYISLAVAGLLLAIGASMDPAIILPWGPFAAPPEQVGATFTRCGVGPYNPACVVDGDTLRLGTRRVRITGLDAPELRAPKCPAEKALAERAANRLLQLVNQGDFVMVPHRFNRVDRHGRDLRMLYRGEVSLGQQLIDEGLAHRYYGVKTRFC